MKMKKKRREKNKIIEGNKNAEETRRERNNK